MKIKDSFINNEVWTLTFGAAFQRANIYTILANDKNKKVFKLETQSFVERDILPLYRASLMKGDADHLENIQKISDYTEKFDGILNNGRLNFGVSQKILNLLLKYKWCIDDYPEPPHFPLDRRIQEILNLNPIISWTQITTSEEYMKIINKVRALKNDKTLAQFELEKFERRRNMGIKNI